MKILLIGMENVEKKEFLKLFDIEKEVLNVFHIYIIKYNKKIIEMIEIGENDYEIYSEMNYNGIIMFYDSKIEYLNKIFESKTDSLPITKSNINIPLLLIGINDFNHNYKITEYINIKNGIGIEEKKRIDLFLNKF